MDKIKLLIADDHQIILDGLKVLLDQVDQFEIVGMATTGEEVLRKVQETEELDIVILDINMPEKDGIEVTTEIKSSYPEIKILIVTMYNRQEFVKSLMEIGVDGYILKNAGRDELVRAIHSLNKGEPFYSKEITKTVIMSYQKQRVFDNTMDIQISDREKDIIRLISDGLSTQEIGEKLFLSTHTINTHRKNILSKLNVKNSAGVIRYGIQTGIVKDFDY